VQRLHRGRDGRSDHVLELHPGEADALRGGRQEHRDGRLVVERKGLLGQDTFLPQPMQGDGVVPVVWIGRRDGTVQLAVDVAQDRLVEIDSAHPFDALGTAEDLHFVRLDQQDRGVERAAAEVVHRDDVAVRQLPGGGVVRGRGQGFGHQVDVGQAGQPRHLVELLQPVRSPHRRPAQHDPLRRRALDPDCAGDGIPQRGGQQRRG
jgi:hypothetical protein